MLGTPIQIPLICVSGPQACVAAVMETNSKWWHTVFLSFSFTILVLQFFLSLCPGVGVGTLCV